MTDSPTKNVSAPSPVWLRPPLLSVNWDVAVPSNAALGVNTNLPVLALIVTVPWAASPKDSLYIQLYHTAHFTPYARLTVARTVSNVVARSVKATVCVS
jgi:hypothetical protein